MTDIGAPLPDANGKAVIRVKPIRGGIVGKNAAAAVRHAALGGDPGMSVVD